MVQPTDTHCPYCGLQCGMTLIPQSAENGGIGWSVAARDFPTNKGGLCRKGWTASDLLTAPGRLTAPLMREAKGTPLRETTWDAALTRIADTIRAAQSAYGKDSIGVFGGGGLTNEKAYLLGKFARIALGTANIDYNGRFCMASAAAAGVRSFGVDRGLPFPLADIPSAETIILAGANPAETMPPIMQYFEAQQANGGRLIVSDPRRTMTARAAGLHLQLTPGTDGALANGLLHVAVRDGLIDQDFIAARTSGFDAIRRIVASYWPDRVERITGVPARLLDQAAHWLGEAATAMAITARGAEQQSHGVDNVQALINLMLALGKIGKPGCGYGCLTGQGNGQGGREHGQKADQLPGYRKLDDPAHRAEIAAIWGVTPESLPNPGLSAVELLDIAGEPAGLRVLIVMGSNVVMSTPGMKSLPGRLAGLELLVVADSFLSETAAQADIVLPVTQWAEEEGTMTNLEGRILLRRRALPPPPGVWTDAQVIAALAERLGHGDKFTDDPRRIFDELRRASAGGVADYGGVTWERIADEDGVFWPCVSADDPGSSRLFMDRFPTADGRARFHPVHERASAETPDAEYPFFLTTGRVLAQYQTGTQTRRIAALNEAAPEAMLEMHPDMAHASGIADGDHVRLITRRGEAVFRAQLDPTMRMDTLFVPFHWSGAATANLLTNPALDPISKIPEFKVCAVRIEKIPVLPLPNALPSPEALP
jgi:assimilatory nitrate reductase catalytic subunit